MSGCWCPARPAPASPGRSARSWPPRTCAGTCCLIDGKGEEANIWESACRVAVEGDEITDAVDEAHGEMTRRKVDMKKRGISVWDGRQLTVVVDEGQVILALIARTGTGCSG